MKKLSILLSVVLLLTLAACGQSRKAYPLSDSDYTQEAVYWRNDAIGYSCVLVGSAVGSRFSRIYKTANGGKTWSQIFDSATGEGDRVDFYITGIFFSDDLHGVIVGGNSAHDNLCYMFTTGDGGQTWSDYLKDHADQLLPPGYSFDERQYALLSYTDDWLASQSVISIEAIDDTSARISLLYFANNDIYVNSATYSFGELTDLQTEQANIK